MSDAVTQDNLQTLRPIKELDILWITAGLGCDGESVAMTAATQPSIEDIILGALPGKAEEFQWRQGHKYSCGV